MEPLVIRALKRQPISRPPVWMMRQAGRYLPEYRELKTRHDFLTLCKIPELAAEITLQPIRRLKPDAAIIFADILLPAEAMGFQIAFNPGPKVANAIKTPGDAAAVKTSPAGPKGKQQSKLQYVFDALTLVRAELAKTEADEGVGLFGFAGAPWTMAAYLIDQGPYKHFQGTQVFAAEHPAAMESLLAKISDVTAEYLLGQIEHGAQAVQLFDTWAGNLSAEDYKRWALPCTQKIFEKVGVKGVPMILYINGSAHLLPQMAQSGAQCLGLDWRTDLAAAESTAGPGLALQGNFDPTHLYRSAADVAAETETMLRSLTRRTGYVANLGHGILQHTPVENAQAFISTVQRGWPR